MVFPVGEPEGLGNDVLDGLPKPTASAGGAGMMGIGTPHACGTLSLRLGMAPVRDHVTNGDTPCGFQN